MVKYVVVILLFVELYARSIFSWGYNSNGQLAIGNTINKWLPSETNLTNPKYVYSGYLFGFIITYSDQVYCYGSNSNYELGLNDTSDRYIATQNIYLSNLNISYITSGIAHSFVITNNYTIYGFGTNQNGEIGLGNNIGWISMPTILGFFNGSSIQSINSGNSHTIVVLTNSSVYSWGLNTYGQLGQSNTRPLYIPTIISSMIGIGISAVETGGDTTYLYTTDGVLYSFGFNGGKIGIGSFSNAYYIPTRVPFFNNRKILKISSGLTHTIIMDSNYIIYALGSNSYGQLGISGSSLATPSQISFFNLYSVNNVYVSYFSSFVITTDLRIFSFGSGINGILGTASFTDQTIPTELYALSGNFNLNNTFKLSNAQHLSFVPDYDCFGLVKSDPLVCSGLGVCSYLNKCVCNAGTYQDGKNCISCPAGTFSNSTGMTSISTCLPCPSNSYSILTQCVYCLQGYFLSGGKTCQTCPIGTYQPIVGSVNITSCIFCSAGTFNDIFAAKNCKPCTIGCFGGSILDAETALSNQSSSVINDPMDLLFAVSDYNLMIIKYTKISILIFIILPLIIIFIIGWIISCRLFKNPILDFFYAESANIMDREARVKKKSRLGEFFTGMSIIFIFVISASVVTDFFFNNKTITKGFEFVKNNDIRINIDFTLNISNGASFCRNTKFTFQNMIPNNGANLSAINNYTTCNLYLSCKNCSVIGTQQRLCFSFTGDSSSQLAYTNSFLYRTRINSVVDDSLYSISGSTIPSSNSIFYGTDPTIIYMSIFQTRFTQLALSYISSLYHSADIFVKLPDYNYFGYSGTYTNTFLGNTNQLSQSTNGFTICFDLNFLSNLYYIHENINVSMLQLIAILASSISAIIIINKSLFKIANKIHIRWLRRLKKRMKEMKEKSNLKIEINLEEKQEKQ